MNIIAAMDDPALFGPSFEGPTWSMWRAVLKAAFALPMSPAELKMFHVVAGDRPPPKRQVRELWIIAGRRAGKDSIASLIAAYFAGFVSYPTLRPGEVASCMCLAVDRTQAGIVSDYTRSYFREIALLRGVVKRDTGDSLELTTRAELIILPSEFRRVRGRSIACVIMDELAYWRSEFSASPDSETYAALRPSMASIPGAMLVAISSPYRRAGLLYEKWKDHFGKDTGDDVLCLHGPSQVFNTSPWVQGEIDAAMKLDPVAARCDWMSQWRDDVGAYLSRELIEAAVDRGVVVRAPQPNVLYVAFVDPSGGVHDSFTAAVAHREQNGMVVLDALYEMTSPCDPAQATAEIAKLAKSYGVDRVTGDRYAQEWPVQEFSRNDITMEHSERDRSSIYVDFLPLLTSGRARLLDSQRMLVQLANLERKAAPRGKDVIDHPKNGHDDLINSAAGAMVLAGSASTLDYGIMVDGIEGANRAPREAKRPLTWDDVPGSYLYRALGGQLW